MSYREFPLTIRISVQGAEEVYASFRDAQQGLNRMVSAQEEAIGAMQGAATQVKATTRDYLEFGTSVSGLVSGLTSLAFSLDSLQRAKLNAQRSALALERAETSVIVAQKALNDLISKGITSGDQYTIAQERLISAQERVTYMAQRVELAQNGISHAYVNFALSILPTLSSSLLMYDKIEKMEIGTKIAATLAQHGLNKAVMGFPLTWILAAIAGVIAAFTILYTQVPEFKNFIDNVGKSIMSVLKPAVDTIYSALLWLWQNVLSPVISVFRQLWDAITDNPILSALFGPITAITFLFKHWDDIVRGFTLALRALSDFFAPLTDAMGRFTNAVASGWAWLSSAISNAVTNFTAQMVVLTGQADVVTAKLRDAERDRLNNLQKSLDAQLKALEDKYSEQERIINNSYTEIENEIAQKWLNQLNITLEGFDKVYAAYNDHYDKLIKDVQTALDKELNTINKTYDDIERDIQNSYDAQIASTNAFYDAMIGITSARLDSIRKARRSELDDLELSYLLQKKAIKDAYESGTVTADAYESLLTDISAMYRSQREKISDEYRIQELMAEKDHARNVAAQEEARASALAVISENEKNDLLRLESMRASALEVARKTAADKIVSIEQERVDKLAAIRADELALEAEHQRELNDLFTKKANERLNILTDYENERLRIINESNALISAIERISPPSPSPTPVAPSFDAFESFGYIGMSKGGIATKPGKFILGEAGPEAVIPLTGSVNDLLSRLGAVLNYSARGNIGSLGGVAEPVSVASGSDGGTYYADVTVHINFASAPTAYSDLDAIVERVQEGIAKGLKYQGVMP